ncbi:terminase [Halomonas daqingensis]|uniref:Terminase n=1 Tax=Billgrantia desiderata TaxID=52021 RepID=A0AAW4YW66_9GAMM|nr:terminase TerL endonuclease subunit [Halomonas desiderata]MCE8052286.1 terminase [Halomonas desiderata]
MDVSRAERNIQWIEEHCYIPDGKLVGQQVRLSEAQKDWLRTLYGTPTRTFILSMPRKNAKTALTAFLLLLHLVGPEAVRNGQLYSSAQSRDQAAILFKYAAASVRMSPSLREFVTIKDTAKSLECPGLGTVYRALSAEAKTAHGLSPVFIVHDELGQVRGPRSELYDTLETGSAAHENPLSVIISTQAATDNDLLSLLIDDALSGADPAKKVILYTCNNDKIDAFSEEALALANPHWFDFMNRNEVLSIAKTAKRMPSQESAYRNLHLNQRVEASDPFVSKQVWQDNGQIPDDWRGQKVWAGLDLSSVSDLTSLVLVTERGDVFNFSWLPADGIHEKSRRDRVAWDTWADQGHISLCPGRSISYDFVAAELLEIFEECDIQGIAFDRYGFKYLRSSLEAAGFTEGMLEKFVDFGQGFISMGPALRTLETLLLDSKLRHGNNPILQMCAANAVTTTDPAGNRKFAKPGGKDSSRKIDSMVALAMAVGIRQSVEIETKTKTITVDSLHFF